MRVPVVEVGNVWVGVDRFGVLVPVDVSALEPVRVFVVVVAVVVAVLVLVVHRDVDVLMFVG